jgi:hypothetical protein
VFCGDGEGDGDREDCGDTELDFVEDPGGVMLTGDEACVLSITSKFERFEGGLVMGAECVMIGSTGAVFLKKRPN